jgi:hypothetical protein
VTCFCHDIAKKNCRVGGKQHPLTHLSLLQFFLYNGKTQEAIHLKTTDALLDHDKF